MTSKNKKRKPERQHENLDQFQWGFLHPRYWLLWLWFAVLWLIGRLPLKAIRALGRGVGLLTLNLAKSRRKITLRNLELCFPEKSEAERFEIAKDSFAGAGMALFESGLVWYGSHKRIQSMLHVSGMELLKRQHGKPTLMLAMHNTCLEMAYGPLAYRHAMKILFRAHNNPFWEWMAQKGRNRHNLELVSNKRVRKFLDYIEQGETGLMAADHDLGARNSLFVPFFNIQTATVPTPSGFAQSTGAKVLFSCGYRTPTGYCVDISEIDNFPSDNQEHDMQRFNKLVEDHVRLHPADYMWMHRRFKTRPEGEPSLYLKNK